MVTRLARVAATCGALADPTRLGVLQRLAQGPATAGQLARLFAVSRPAVSRHVRVLREAGLVFASPHGRLIWYAAEADPLRELEMWLGDTAKRIDDAPRLLED